MVAGADLAATIGFHERSQVIKVVASGGVLTPASPPGQVTYGLAELQAVVTEAHHAGLRVAAHAIGTQGIKDALRAGVDSVEHGFYLDDEAIDLLLAREVYLVPSLSGIHWSLHHPDAAAQLEPWLRAKCESVRDGRHRCFERAAQAGVRFATGTDVGTPFDFHGNVATEVALLREYCSSAADALFAATRHAAANLGLLDRCGTLEPGKDADVLIVDGDPLADLGVLAQVRHVLRAGEVVNTAPVRTGTHPRRSASKAEPQPMR